MVTGESPAITSAESTPAGIALGSNLGDRLENLRRARALLCALPGVRAGSCESAPVFETAPVGCEPGAADFFNTVVAVQIDPSVAPQNFLARLRAIEIQLGRPAENLRARNVSRVIDLDLLYLGDSVLATPTLTLPHPRVSQRRFVLAPLAALRPHLILPGQRANVAALLAALGPAETDDAAAVRLVAAHW